MSKPTNVIRLAVVSDIHLEDRSAEWLDTDELVGRADLLVAAGDIDTGIFGLSWCNKAAVPCVYVLGNCEFDGGSYLGVRGRLALLAPQYPNVHLLDDSVVELEIRGIKVKFIGGTLWTDYAALGKRHREASMVAAWRGLDDHRRILFGGGFWLPDDARVAFENTKALIATELAEPIDGLKVVVTHHSPTLRAAHPRFEGDELIPAYHSNLDTLVKQADVWVFGHTHHGVDFRLGRCRVISNPRGYPGENPSFKLRIFEIPVVT
jgi:predicted phosphodiesterase